MSHPLFRKQVPNLARWKAGSDGIICLYAQHAHKIPLTIEVLWCKNYKNGSNRKWAHEQENCLTVRFYLRSSEDELECWNFDIFYV